MENEEKQPEETNNLGSGPAPAEVWTNDTSSIAERKTVPGTSKGLEGLSDILRNYKNTIEKEGATPSELNRMKKDLESLLPEAGDLLNSVNKALEKVDQNGISNDEKIKVDENNNVETAEGNSSQYAYNEPTLNEPDRRFNANDYSLGGQQKEPEARPTYTYNEPTLNEPDRRFNADEYSLGGQQKEPEARPTYTYNEPTLNEPDRRFNADEYSLGGQQKEPEARPTYTYNEPTLNEPDRRFNADEYSLGGQQKEPEARPTYTYNEPTLNEPDRRFNADEYSLGGQQKEPEARPTYTYNEPTLNAPDRRFNVNDYSLGGMAPVAPPNIPKGKDTVRPSNVNITVTNQAYFKKQSDGR